MSDKVIKYLGIDWGEKRIGLALGDSETKIAIPYKVAHDIKELLTAVKKEEVDALVVGQPLAISGTGQRNTLFDEFLRDLASQTELPIKLTDERLTSKAADALPGDRKTKAPRDAVAAMLILQGHLDQV